MRRREFITLLGGAAAWPFEARAQQTATPVIGFLTSRASSAVPYLLDSIRLGLREAGFIEGQNVAIEYRFAENQIERLPALAADLVRRQVAVITAVPDSASLAAKAATTTIPIVFEGASDPVAIGLVASLNRPGGNITGVTNLSVEVAPKRLQLLHELLPSAGRIALLLNPTNSIFEPQLRELHAAARTLGLPQSFVQHASTERDLDKAFAALVEMRAEGLVIGNDAFYSAASEQLAALALRYGIPTVYAYRDFTRAGGLLSYGTVLADAYRLAGVYTGRVLKGEKPADLPVQRVTKVELTVNLKTAKAFGITVPLPLLARADEVIE
jgi:putative tryptophan/tyrosine transport system substrate-binding protein